MDRPAFENKSLVLITLIAYFLNWVFGIIGYYFTTDNSTAQMLIYQVGNATAITGSVFAGRYVGLRGQHVTASAFILLGITHGISLGALGRSTINIDRGITMVMPMVPALIAMLWCRLFPLWLRLSSLVPAVFFTLLYIKVSFGHTYFGWPLLLGYGTLQCLELIWSIYFIKDWRMNKLKQ